MQDLALRASSLSSSLPLLQPLWTLTSAGVSSTTIYNGASSKVALPSSLLSWALLQLFSIQWMILQTSLIPHRLCICADDCHLVADYFINRQQVQTLSAYLVRGPIWAVSVGLYHYMLHSESTIGATLPAFTMAFVVTTIVGFLSKAERSQQKLNNHNRIYSNKHPR